MPNIKFSYLYRDGGNNKKFNSLILTNADNLELSALKSLIASKLIDGMWFYANEWKIPDLHFSNWDTEIDHTWHEFTDVEQTDDQPNVPYDLKDLIAQIEKTHWYKKFDK